MLFQKFIAGTVILGLVGFVFLSMGAPVQAQSAQDTINQFLSQIKELQAKIQGLQRQQQELQQQKQETVLKLVKTLWEGARGDEVRTLQALLAADPEIYPEGLITGYFGRLTAKAVKRFQKKHDIDQIGLVGPKTLKKLSELLKEHPLATETSTTTEKKLCAIVPPGHLIAPGWLKKQGGVRPVVPECQVLPPGIVQKLPGTGATDTIAPSISSLAVSNIASTTATISWTTNEAATGKVYYSITAPLNLGTASTTSDSALITSHQLNLSLLSASTTYYYVAESKDAANNTATSSQQTFITLP